MVAAKPLTLIARSKVEDNHAGPTSGPARTGQAAGGSIGRAILGTVAWTVGADTARNPANATWAAAPAAAQAARQLYATAARVKVAQAGAAADSRSSSRMAGVT